MSDIALVVRGNVVLPRQTLPGGYVAVGQDGAVVAVGRGVGPAAAEIADYGDCLVLPGAIDGQVHSRSQAGQEDFVWSTRAAAAGGVTTIVDMPYDDGNLIATGDKLRTKAREAGAQARVDFALYGTLPIRTSNGAEVADLVDGRRRGVQILDLRDSSDTVSAHPAANAFPLLRRHRPDGPHGRRAQRERRIRARLRSPRSRRRG